MRVFFFLIVQLAIKPRTNSPRGCKLSKLCSESLRRVYAYTTINVTLFVSHSFCNGFFPPLFRMYICTHSGSAAGSRPCSPPVWSGSRRTECWSDCGSPALQPAACDWPGPAGRRARLRLWLTAVRPPRDSRSSPEHTGRCQERSADGSTLELLELISFHAAVVDCKKRKLD